MTTFASPVLAKTWQFQVSQAIALQATVALTNGRGLRLAKDSMTGAGAWTDSSGAATASTNNWQVVSSSDGAAAGNNDNNDRWLADANVIWANAGVAHSWVVLKQAAFPTPYYLCIDCVGADTSRLDYAWSSNPFTGGTVTNRPTSVGEAAQVTAGYPLASSRNWGGPTTNAASVLHVMKSSDGLCTRIMIARNGWSMGLWVFDELISAPAAVASPAIAVLHGNNTAAPAVSSLTQANFSNSGNFTPLTQLNGTYPGYCMMDLSFYQTNSLVTVPTVQNDLAAAWPLIRIKVNTPYNLAGGNGLTPNTTPAYRVRGQQGMLRDIWWVQSQLGEADYAPAAGTRNFLIVGDFCLPWNTTVATMT